MADLDQVLAPLLERPLAAPEPMADLERRAGRFRRQRRLRLAGAEAAATAAVAVVFALAGGDDSQLVRTIPPATNPPGPPTPHDLPFGSVTRLGGITIEGDTWDIVGGPSGAGFCFGLRQGSGIGGGCGGPPLQPGEVFSVSPPESGMRRPGQAAPAWVLESRAPFLYGFVTTDVATIRLHFQDGTTVDVAPTGAEAGLPFNAYAVAIPPGAVPVWMVALAPDGTELARRGQPLWPVPPPPPCPSVSEGAPCAPVAPGSDISAFENWAPPITPPTIAPG